MANADMWRWRTRICPNLGLRGETQYKPRQDSRKAHGKLRREPTFRQQNLQLGGRQGGDGVSLEGNGGIKGFWRGAKQQQHPARADLSVRETGRKKRL